MNAADTAATEALLTEGVAQFRRAKDTFNNSRLGSAKGDQAERTMNRLVARADRLGCLLAFCTAVNA
jgi:hypothetical protein